MTDTAFRVVPIAAIDCYRESWDRIRDQYWLFVGITAVGMLLGSMGPLGMLLGPMMCGLYLCHLQKSRGAVVSFGLLWKGFDHFAESFIAVLCMMAAGLVIVMPVAFVMFGGFILVGALVGQSHEPAWAVLFIPVYLVSCVLMMVLGSLIGALFVFTFLLIVDKRIPGFEAVKLSAGAAWANVWSMIKLMLLGMVLSIVGMCFCYVGAFLVAPVTFGAIVVAYQRVFGSEPAGEPHAPVTATF
jgi:hypothetical protein